MRRKGQGYIIYGIPSNHGSRLGVVVSTRFGRGVKRNRLRRRLREAARLNRAHWPHRMDLVVRAIDGSPAEMEFTKLVSDVGRTFGKLTNTAS